MRQARYITDKVLHVTSIYRERDPINLDQEKINKYYMTIHRADSERYRKVVENNKDGLIDVHPPSDINTHGTVAPLYVLALTNPLLDTHHHVSTSRVALRLASHFGTHARTHFAA